MSSSGSSQPIRFQLPHRVIRKLRRGSRFRRAHNLLIVANGCADMVRLLNRSGINTAGIDDDPVGVLQEAPAVHFGSVAGGFPYSPHAFDLAIVGPCRALQHGLNGPESLIAVANVLSSLRTNGRLVWLRTSDSVQMDSADIADGLAHFGGELTACDYEDGWERFLSLEWLIGRHRNLRLQLTTLTVPRRPVSRLSWHKIAREAALARVSERQEERAA